MKILYFAWVRERVGLAEETIDPPPGVETAADLMAWLAQRDEGYAHAFENPKVIHVAADQKHVKATAPLAGVKEVAFFPPMTGG